MRNLFFERPTQRTGKQKKPGPTKTWAAVLEATDIVPDAPAFLESKLGPRADLSK
jgi:hypothetical protein